MLPAAGGKIFPRPLRDRIQGVVLAFLDDHVREVEAIFDGLSKLLVNRGLALSLLELFVGLYALPDYSHVGVHLVVEGLHEVGDVLMALPALDLLEKAHVDDDGRGRSTNARGAVDIHIQILIVEHVIQMLSSKEQIRLQLFVSEVIHRESHRFDALLLVGLLHLPPGVASLPVVVDGHQVQNAGDARLGQPLDVLFLAWVGPDADARIPHLCEKQFAQEVAVGFLDMAVDDPDLVPVPPLARLLRPKLPSVAGRILNLHDSGGLSLVDEILRALAAV